MHKSSILRMQWFVNNYVSKINKSEVRVLDVGSYDVNGFGEHRHPVDCYRFFTDGMLALARYVNIEPLHAHTNCAPSVSAEEWYSDTFADSILIARKPYAGKPKHPDLQSYQCVPGNQEMLRSGLFPYKKKKGVYRLWSKIKKRAQDVVKK